MMIINHFYLKMYQFYILFHIHPQVFWHEPSNDTNALDEDIIKD